MVDGRQSKEKKGKRFSVGYILQYLDSSIVLSSIMAGYAILTTLRAFLDNFSLAISGWQPFIELFSRSSIVIITCIRFYHGNTAWHRIRYKSIETELHESQITATHLIDLYIHVLQYLLFAVVGYNILEANRFFLLLAIVSFIDVLWTILGWVNAKDIMRRAMSTWCLLNLGTGSGALIVYLCIDAKLWYVSPLALVVYVIAAIIDYLLNPKLFLGIEEVDSKERN